MTWVLIIVLVGDGSEGRGQNSASSVPGFVSRLQCESAAQEVHKMDAHAGFRVHTFTACVAQGVEKK